MLEMRRYLQLEEITSCYWDHAESRKYVKKVINHYYTSDYDSNVAIYTLSPFADSSYLTYPTNFITYVSRSCR